MDDSGIEREFGGQWLEGAKVNVWDACSPSCLHLIYAFDIFVGFLGCAGLCCLSRSSRMMGSLSIWPNTVVSDCILISGASECLLLRILLLHQLFQVVVVGMVSHTLLFLDRVSEGRCGRCHGFSLMVVRLSDRPLLISFLWWGRVCIALVLVSWMRWESLDFVHLAILVAQVPVFITF